MRYVILFNEENKQEGSIHFQGLQIDTEEAVKDIGYPNFKRFSEEMLIALCGADFEEKMHFIELDEQGEAFFNQEAYDEREIEVETPIEE